MGLKSQSLISPEVLRFGSTKNTFEVVLILYSCFENFSPIASETKQLENFGKVNFC